MNLTTKFLFKVKNRKRALTLKFFNILTAASALIILSSCVSNNFTKTRVAKTLAEKNGFKQKLVKGNNFWFTTFQNIKSEKLPYVIYIEGDGTPFAGRNRISNDPTPKNPMMLDLATKDPRINVVYIARPCQYTPMEMNPACNKLYWTDKRMSEDSVFAMNDAIKKIAGDNPVDLVGFSGGGGMAVLIAVKNKNVRTILTIAGNLDHVEFNKYHNVRPMIGSLNPIDFAKDISNIPQLHVSGGRDTIVPAFITDKFVERSNSNCVNREIIPNASHQRHWNSYWSYIISIPIKCR